jgi:hypothetical protein
VPAGSSDSAEASLVYRSCWYQAPTKRLRTRLLTVSWELHPNKSAWLRTPALPHICLQTGKQVCMFAGCHLAFSVKASQTLFHKPIVDRLDENVLHIPIVLDGVHVELLDCFRFQPSNSSALSLP